MSRLSAAGVGVRAYGRAGVRARVRCAMVRRCSRLFFVSTGPPPLPPLMAARDRPSVDFNRFSLYFLFFCYL